MGNIDIIASAIGIITTALAVVGNQFRNMKYVLLFQITANTLLGVQYILQGTAAASVSVYLAIVQMIISMIFNMKGRKFPIALCIAFVFAYVTAAIALYSGPWDILTLAAMVFCAVSVVQTRSAVYRLTLTVNLLLWLVYDIVKAPSAIIMHATLLVFTAVAIVRLDRGEIRGLLKKILKRKEKNNGT